MTPRLVVALAAVLLLGACSLPGAGKAQATPSGSPVPSPLGQASGPLNEQVPMPAGFPSDVPIYPGARLTAGASFTSTGVVTWGMEWETLDSVDKVHAFYAEKFAQGDWTITFSGASSTVFTATFARKSNSHVTGALGGDGSSGVTKITMSLVNPA
jgi:hypothetical protein